MFGATGGIIVGAIPGLTAPMAVALLTPLTFTMSPDVGILMLLGIFCGCIYGGSITAILIQTPGTASAVATIFDGYPMTLKGQAGKAMGIALFSSGAGGIISALILMFLAPQLAKVALKFGPPEYFGITFFGLSIISSVSGKSLLKGLIAATIGLLIATIGIDPISGVARYTFGQSALMSGLHLIPVIIGIFAASEVLFMTEEAFSKISIKIQDLTDVLPTIKEIKYLAKTIVKSSLIGTFIGSIPGTGAAIAAFVSYSEAKRSSKHPEKFGTGIIEGVAAPEAANNAVTGGALVPLLTFGIPGDTTTAVLLGAFMLQGLTPGPQLFIKHGDVIFALFAGLILINIFIIIIGSLNLSLFARIAMVPKRFLAPIVMVFCFVGSYTIRNSMLDVVIMLILGVLGFFMRKYKFPGGPLIIAFILAPIIEESIRQSLILSRGSWLIFLTRPICIVFIILSIFFVLWQSWGQKKLTNTSD